MGKVYQIKRIEEPFTVNCPWLNKTLSILDSKEDTPQYEQLIIYNLNDKSRKKCNSKFKDYAATKRFEQRIKTIEITS